MNEYIIDNYLDWLFRDEYKLGPDGIWYPVDNNDTINIEEQKNEK